MKLDIGCGRCKVEGAIGIDIREDTDADVICDIERSLPFRDESFDEIYCNQLVEHVSDLISLMEEIYRVGKANAKVFIEAPYFTHRGAFSDPTHKNFITEYTFDYFTGTRCGFYTKSRFKVERISYSYGIVPRLFFFIPKFLFRRFLLNSTCGISFELTVVK